MFAASAPQWSEITWRWPNMHTQKINCWRWWQQVWCKLTSAGLFAAATASWTSRISAAITPWTSASAYEIIVARANCWTWTPKKRCRCQRQKIQSLLYSTSAEVCKRFVFCVLSSSWSPWWMYLPFWLNKSITSVVHALGSVCICVCVWFAAPFKSSDLPSKTRPSPNRKT